MRLPSHLQANYKPTASHPHATHMGPTWDPHATLMRPSSHLHPLAFAGGFVHRLHYRHAGGGFTRGDQGLVLGPGDGIHELNHRDREGARELGVGVLAVGAGDFLASVVKKAVHDDRMALGAADE